MGIRIEQPGAAKAAATAGTAVGKAQRAEEDRARAEREQARANAETAQKKARQAAMDWELQKMQLRSEQDFQQELTNRQWDYEKFNRAKAWDIEKLELRSRMDFEQEEQERVQETSRVDAKILALKKVKETGQFTGREFEFESMMFDLEQQKFGVKNQIKTLDPQQRLLYDIQRQAEADASGGTTAPGGGVPVPTGELTVQNMEAIAAVGKTYLRRKSDGSLVEVPIERAKEAVATGRFVFPKVADTLTRASSQQQQMGFYPAERTGAGTGPGTLVGRAGEVVDRFLARRWAVTVISPEGKQEEIDNRDWPEYEKRGYKRAPSDRPETRFNF